MDCKVTLLPENRILSVPRGTNLLEALRRSGRGPDAPCGGQGSCGKCRVLADGQAVLACGVTVEGDMTVTVGSAGSIVLTAGEDTAAGAAPGHALAFDIGTTTVAGFLLEGQTGREMAVASRLNPQAPWGADVITRIRQALNGQLEALTAQIRGCVTDMIRELCGAGGIGPGEIRRICIVGNPAMRQLFLGISPENLAKIPFSPVLTATESLPAKDFLPLLSHARLLQIPDIAGFVGADTLACVLSSRPDRAEELTLLVDIGTNAEMVLAKNGRMVACAAAAGPALEGANIRFGMRGGPGAIDHVYTEGNHLRCTVIGGGAPRGICGSGLIDAAARALELGLIDSRGRVLTENRTIPLAGDVYLDQEDIRQLQLAKGAIAAGIRLMARQLGAEPGDIRRVYLAGAFGTYLDPEAACHIGLLPDCSADRVTALGNAAGSGAKMLARNPGLLETAGALAGRMEFLELGALPDFRRQFAQCMRF